MTCASCRLWGLGCCIAALLGIGVPRASEADLAGEARQAPMTSASRVTGFAPLAVHFGAVGAASGVVQPAAGDFDELSYLWDFGDPGSGVWAVDGGSRNAATGFVAGHVFELPGSYVVELTVIDAQAQTSTYQQAIEVLDPDVDPGWTTYYVAANGSDSNPGTSSGAPFATFAHAMTFAGPKTRILLRRGDTLPAETTWINTNGPAIIGAYGSGDRPALHFASGDGIRFGWSTDNQDWRIIGVRIEGDGISAALFAEGTDLSQLLVWDVEIESWGAGVVLSASCDAMDQNVVAASTILDITDAWTIYMGGTRSFIQGNVLDKQTTANSHTYRNWCADGLSVTHNTFGPAYHHSMKLHSPGWVAGEPSSQNVVITDNTFEGSTWTVAIGPQDSGSDERVRNVRYERNLHLRTSNTGLSVAISAAEVTVRNNIFINNLAGSYEAVSVFQRGIEPPPQDNCIYNNTFFAEQGDIVSVSIASVAADTAVRNNLLAPTTGGFVIDGSGIGLVASNNLATDAPCFLDPAARKLMLRPGSPAIDAGVDIGVLFDYAGATRDSIPDVGAYELVALIFADGFESGTTGAW
jgi:hypothetical protein